MNILKNVKLRLPANTARIEAVYLQLLELEWAHIYHDSIRGRPHLEQLALNIGRWAGSYSFFYVLNRILCGAKPSRIIEFGLGESTKFMSNIIYHELKLSNLLTIEHDFEWLENYKKENTLFPNCDTLLLPLTKREVNGFQVNSYEGIENIIIGPYDLYVVDGPFGSDRFSRYDIVRLLNNIDKGHEFIVVMDDAHRRGELDTLRCIVNLLERKGIYVSSSTYRGNKDVLVLFTERYKFCSSL